MADNYFNHLLLLSQFRDLNSDLTIPFIKTMETTRTWSNKFNPSNIPDTCQINANLCWCGSGSMWWLDGSLSDNLWMFPSPFVPSFSIWPRSQVWNLTTRASDSEDPLACTNQCKHVRMLSWSNRHIQNDVSSRFTFIPNEHDTPWFLLFVLSAALRPNQNLTESKGPPVNEFPFCFSMLPCYQAL